MRTCPTCQRSFIDSQDVCPLDDARLGAGDGTTAPGLGRVLGSYRLVCLLGEGGMCNVFIGAHTRLNRCVAIKVLRDQLRYRKEHIARFFEEARTVNRLAHPNIVESLDLVEDVVDGSYCVLELLHGPDLKSRLRGGPLPLDAVIHIGTQLGDALSAVHAIDIVHRDLKPENVILIERGGRDDFVKLIDFGIAQISDEGAAGVPLGTPAYMAPEQAAGERVDGRADVYALGLLLFEMTTGRHPFPSTSDHEYLLAHADASPPKPSKLVPDVPGELEALILRCLAKSPADRFPTAAEVAGALRAIDVRVPRRRGRATRIAVALGVIGLATAAALVVPRLRLAGTPAPASVPPVAKVAVAAPPMPPPPAPASAEVTIVFTSTPPGARVVRIGETVPLGVTPFATTFARSASPAKVRIEHEGYEPAVIAVALDASHETSTELAIAPRNVDTPSPGTVTRRKPKPVTLQREGTIDPFAH